MQNATMIRRGVAVAAVVGVLVIVLVLVMAQGKYEVKADFVNASQVVKGNTVQVSGTPIGKVSDIQLTQNGLARLTLEIQDGDYKPLRRGTKFIVRATSLSGVANRYIDLSLPPGDDKSSGTYKNDSVIPTTQTTSAVDLDQIFNTFGKPEQKGLQQIIHGSSRAYHGTAEEARAGFEFMNPAVAASTRLFQELGGDTHRLRRYLVSSAKLVGTLATKQNDLAALVNNTATMMGALSQPPGAIERSLVDLPPFMRQANTTFVNLRSTLDYADPLVNEAKPLAPKLRPFFADLRGFAHDALPTVRDLSAIIAKPGPDNDLINLLQSSVPLAHIAVGPVFRNGKVRQGALPASTRALRGATPLLAFARPYSVDLTGWFDDFSHSGVYDANGGVSRVAPVLNALSLQQNGDLLPVPPQLRQAFFNSQATTGLYNRCPGSAARVARDHSNPWRPSSGYNCDPSQLPTGP